MGYRLDGSRVGAVFFKVSQENDIFAFDGRDTIESNRKLEPLESNQGPFLSHRNTDLLKHRTTGLAPNPQGIGPIPARSLSVRAASR